MVCLQFLTGTQNVLVLVAIRRGQAPAAAALVLFSKKLAFGLKTSVIMIHLGSDPVPYTCISGLAPTLLAESRDVFRWHFLS